MNADITVMYIKEQQKNESDELQQALDRSAIWLKKYCLTSIASKKRIRFYKKKQNNHHQDTVKVEDTEMHSVALYMYFGIPIDKVLSFQ